MEYFVAGLLVALFVWLNLIGPWWRMRRVARLLNVEFNTSVRSFRNVQLEHDFGVVLRRGSDFRLRRKVEISAATGRPPISCFEIQQVESSVQDGKLQGYFAPVVLIEHLDLPKFYLEPTSSRTSSWLKLDKSISPATRSPRYRLHLESGQEMSKRIADAILTFAERQNVDVGVESIGNAMLFFPQGISRAPRNIFLQIMSVFLDPGSRFQNSAQVDLCLDQGSTGIDSSNTECAI